MYRLSGDQKTEMPPSVPWSCRESTDPMSRRKSALRFEEVAPLEDEAAAIGGNINPRCQAASTNVARFLIAAFYKIRVPNLCDDFERAADIFETKIIISDDGAGASRQAECDCDKR